MKNTSHVWEENTKDKFIESIRGQYNHQMNEYSKNPLLFSYPDVVGSCVYEWEHKSIDEDDKIINDLLKGIEEDKSKTVVRDDWFENYNHYLTPDKFEKKVGFKEEPIEGSSFFPCSIDLMVEHDEWLEHNTDGFYTLSPWVEPLRIKLRNPKYVPSDGVIENDHYVFNWVTCLWFELESDKEKYMNRWNVRKDGEGKTTPNVDKLNTPKRFPEFWVD
jgi:hypothetical protein